jgi:hypothetical protein
MGTACSTHTRKVINTFIILVEKPEGKRTRPHVAGWIITEVRYEDMD